EAVERLLHPAEVGVAQRVTNVIGPLSGAAQFADLIAEAVERMDSVPLSVPKPTVGEDTRALLSLKIHSGSRNRRGRSPTTVLLACLDHSTEELAELATQLRDLQRNRPWITPIVLIGATS